MTESTTFCFALCSTDLIRGIARITNDPINLFAILTKYYKFANIFSKIKAGTLASYCLYNLQIKLENGEKPLVGTIYSLLTTKQEILKKFISKNLNTRFIYSTTSPYKVFILFVKKKDSFLYLCVDF